MIMRIALIGEYTPTFEPHRMTEAALHHSAGHLGIDVDAAWISTAEINDELFTTCDGIWVAPGSPYRNMDKALWAIQQARENGIPCLGTCGGFQHMVIEYARNVLRIPDAQHAEYDPYASQLIISRLSCSLVGKEMGLALMPGSRVACMYGSETTRERYYCNFGINPAFAKALRHGEFRTVGWDEDGEIRIMEKSDHTFFVGTLYVPQARSSASSPHPLITGFAEAVRKNTEAEPSPAPYSSPAAGSESGEA